MKKRVNETWESRRTVELWKVNTKKDIDQIRPVDFK